MACLNENYLKLRAGYLFSEVARRVREFCESNGVTAERWAFCIGKRRLCHGLGLIVSAQRDVATALCRRAAANAMNASTQRGGYSVIKSSAEQLRGSLGPAVSK